MKIESKYSILSAFSSTGFFCLNVIKTKILYCNKGHSCNFKLSCEKSIKHQKEAGLAKKQHISNGLDNYCNR